MSSPYRTAPAAPVGGRDRDVTRFADEVRAERRRGRLLALGLVSTVAILALAPLAGRAPAARRVGMEAVGERSGIRWARQPARVPVSFRLERPWVPCRTDEACDF